MVLPWRGLRNRTDVRTLPAFYDVSQRKPSVRGLTGHVNPLNIQTYDLFG